MKPLHSRIVTTLVVFLSMFALVIGSATAAPKGKSKRAHHSGHDTLSPKGKPDGNHPLERHGKHQVSADTKGGKISAFHVKHDTKGDIAVKKYKSNKKVASLETGDTDGAMPTDDMGTVWIGFAYVDDDGIEQYYWFPYDEVLDPDTGAIDYVPES